jgi:hypothetical protein
MTQKKEVLMPIGYMRVSKADGSQVFDLQKDALVSAPALTPSIFMKIWPPAKKMTAPG